MQNLSAVIPIFLAPAGVGGWVRLNLGVGAGWTMPSMSTVTLHTLQHYGPIIQGNRAFQELEATGDLDHIHSKLPG